MTAAAVLLQAFVIGVAVAAPVGPIALLCIQQTLRSGRIAGIVSGLGVASADAIYSGVAAAGLAAAQKVLIDHRQGLALAAGAVLLALGARIMRQSPPAEPAPVRPGSLAMAYGGIFVLTLANPLTILSFVAIFAGLGAVAGDGSLGQASVLVLGVFLGSASWWIMLAQVTNLARARIGGRALIWLNRSAGAAIAAFGIVSLVRAL